MSSKQWFIFIASFFVLMLILSIFDFCFAGFFYLVILLFEAEVAATVFKWVFVITLFLEMVILPPCLYSTIKDERNEI